MTWHDEDDPVVVITMKRSDVEVWIEPGLSAEQREQVEFAVPKWLDQLRTTWLEKVVDE